MARRIDYFKDLDGIPEEGPFVLTGGCFLTTGSWRIEHALGPDGVGCPKTLNPQLRSYMAANNIPHTEEGADLLNEHWRHGAFTWEGQLLVPLIEKSG